MSRSSSPRTRSTPAWMHGPSAPTTSVAPRRRMPSTAASTTPAGQSPPSGVDGGEDPFGAGQRQGAAVGGEHAQGDARPSRRPARRARRGPRDGRPDRCHRPDRSGGRMRRVDHRARRRRGPGPPSHPGDRYRRVAAEVRRRAGPAGAASPVRGPVGRRSPREASLQAARTSRRGRPCVRRGQRHGLVQRRNEGTSKSSSPRSSSSSAGVAKMSSWAESAPSTRLRVSSRPVDSVRSHRCGRRLGLPPLEPGGDDGDPHLFAHGLVDDAAEDDVGVGVGHAVDDLGRLVDLEQAEVGSAGDVEQDARGRPRSTPRAAGW